jgi:hypothetical protein
VIGGWLEADTMPVFGAHAMVISITFPVKQPGHNADRNAVSSEGECSTPLGKEEQMKTCYSISLLAAMLLIVFTQAAGAQATSQTAPKYDPATEATFNGTIASISERNCPVSGTMGFHFVLKLQDGKTIEVHVAASQMMKTYEITLNKDDQVQVIGSKVQYEGKDTILARQVVRGNDTYVFRDKTGKPVW